ncbi:MAG: hypothetical protein AAF217_08970 [Pseudomonadota bacterium]
MIWSSTCLRQLRLHEILLRCACLLIAITLFLAITANAYEANHKHEKEFKYISEALDVRSLPRSLVHWDMKENPVGRLFTKLDAQEIGQALTQAWTKLTVASRSREINFIEDHFTGTAYRKIKQDITSQTSIEKGMVVLDQKAQARFFHKDGSSIEIKSDDTLIVRYALDPIADQSLLLNVTRECTRQILMLMTVGWKIQNHEIDCSKRVSLLPKKSEKRNAVFPQKGVNYYPAKTPWSEFWSEFDEEIIDRDMKRIASYGGNAVRIFIPFSDFYDQGTSDQALRHLDRFLALAAKHRISVMPTLFDFKGDYIASGWAAEYQYLKQVLPVLKRHQNVQIIDLKNEPDLDYQYHGKATVDLWLTLFAGLVRDLVPDMSVTIGFLNYESAIRLRDIVDVISYHDYEDQAETHLRFETVKAVAEGKRILVTETGQPSWGMAGGFPFSMQSQSQWLDIQLEALKASDGVYVWALYDFEYDDTEGIASLPWRRLMQATYGLFENDGSEKPAGKTFKKFNFQSSLRSDWKHRKETQ